MSESSIEFIESLVMTNPELINPGSYSSAHVKGEDPVFKGIQDHLRSGCKGIMYNDANCDSTYMLMVPASFDDSTIANLCDTLGIRQPTEDEKTNEINLEGQIEKLRLQYQNSRF